MIVEVRDENVHRYHTDQFYIQHRSLCFTTAAWNNNISEHGMKGKRQSLSEHEILWVHIQNKLLHKFLEIYMWVKCGEEKFETYFSNSLEKWFLDDNPFWLFDRSKSNTRNIQSV